MFEMPFRSAPRSETTSWAILDLCMERHFGTVYTREILEEYEAVLTRPKFGFNQSDVHSLLDFFQFRALKADPLFPSLSRPQCADKNDQKFYDAACCWDALLVTGNTKHFPEDDRVLTPAQFFELRNLPKSKILSLLDGR